MNKRGSHMTAVDVVRQGAGRKVPIRALKKIAKAVLQLLDRNQDELSLALVGDQQIRLLNARFRKKNEPTDVLSFPSETLLPSGRRLLGDVVISVEKAERQARARKRRFEDEMVTLLIHGVLHLLGYDHERSAEDARIMSGLERKIYRSLCGQGLIRV
jgi:probable rRNA maturation factor